MLFVKILGWYALAMLAYLFWSGFRKHNDYEAEQVRREQERLLREQEAVWHE